MNQREKEELTKEVIKAKEALKSVEEKHDSRDFAYLRYLEGRVAGLEWVADHLEWYAQEDVVHVIVKSEEKTQ